MGNFSIKAKILRCETCFMLKKLLIEPSCPDSTIVSECSCGFTRTTIKSFVDEIKKKEIYELKCDLCKKEVKQALYCIKCRRLYCNTCKIIHEEIQSNQDEHIYIDSSISGFKKLVKNNAVEVFDSLYIKERRT